VVARAGKRRGVTGALASGLGVLIVLVTACTAAPDLQQKRIENPVRGSSVNASIGALRLLAVRVEAPEDDVHVAGDNVGLFLTIANDGTTPDRLSAVSTVDARDIVLRDGARGPTKAVSVDAPAKSVVSMQYPGGLHLELVDITRDTRGGVFLPMLFRFASAGAVTVNVFVQGIPGATVAPLP
jgi:copper(I)-binding protein